MFVHDTALPSFVMKCPIRTNWQTIEEPIPFKAPALLAGYPTNRDYPVARCSRFTLNYGPSARVDIHVSPPMRVYR